MSATVSDNKNIVTVIISVSLAVLIVVCLGLFWLTWNALSEAERVKEENHQLLLGNTVCQLRLENLQERAPKTDTVDPAPIPTPAPNPVSEPVVPAPAVSDPATSPPRETSSASVPTTSPAATDQAAAPKTAAATAPVILHDPWFVQLGAYKRQLPAEDFVREAADILTDAGFKLSVFAVKKGSHWLVCINEPLTKPRARALAEEIRKRAELESVITRLSSRQP